MHARVRGLGTVALRAGAFVLSFENIRRGSRLRGRDGFGLGLPASNQQLNNPAPGPSSCVDRPWIGSGFLSDHRSRSDGESLSATYTSRRRRWADAKKVRIVEESRGSRGPLADTARRHDMLVRRQRHYREGRLTLDDAWPSFTPLTIATTDMPDVSGVQFAPELPPAPAQTQSRSQTQVAETTLGNGRRRFEPATIDPAMLARLLQALDP